MEKNAKSIAIALGILVLGGLIYTQLPARGGHDSMMSTSASAGESASTKAFETAMGGMMKAMMATPTAKPDLDFMQGMLPHHQGAIDMAKVVLQFGKDAEVNTLAETVIKAQTAEIEVMKDWMGKTDQAKLPVVPASKEANDQAMATMMKNMMVPYTGDADVDFLKGMIPHHQGAIDMAKAALKYGQDPTVLKLAQEVETAQEGEIKFMTDWLKKKGM
jgi:uncharacterized protein (DUF305 family)